MCNSTVLLLDKVRPDDGDDECLESEQRRGVRKTDNSTFILSKVSKVSSASSAKTFISLFPKASSNFLRMAVAFRNPTE
jgi:hypothetical protein